MRKIWCVTLGLVIAVTPGAALGQSAVYLLDEVKNPYPNARTGGNYMHNFYLPPAGTGTPWWPSWSPDGRSLVFSMQGTIWRLKIDDPTAHELTHSKKYLSSPEWSPDGRHITFTADADGESINLRLLQLDTGSVVNLTADQFLNLDPAWSPDSHRLAYVSTRPNGYYNIFVMNIRDGRPGKVTQLTRDHQFGRDRLYFGDYDLHIQPTWTPDGDSLLFVSNRGIPLGSGAVWKMPAVESGIDHAVMVHKEETLYRTRPHVSLDGKRFIYSSHLGGQFNNLFVLPTAGGEPYKMTFGEWDSFHPRWSPDGKWIAYITNRDGLPNLRLLKTYGGLDKPVEIKTLRWKQPMGRVHVRILDSETADLLPSRIYSKASDGKTYVPADAYHRLGRLAEHFFHTAGDFVLEAPAGELVLEAMHGFEFYPSARTVNVLAEETISINLKLSRMTNLQDNGWYSGSNHVHMNYAGNLHNTPENLIFMADAEDVQVIGELVANKDNRILDYQFFTGGLHPLSNDRHLLFFNEEYRPPFYGHISLINLTEHLISPYTTGYQGTAIESLYPSNTDMFRLARKQGALGAYVHPFFGNDEPLDGDLGIAKGFPIDLALGALDYHELVSAASWTAYRVWHHALNNGFELPAVGGEDSISNLHRTAIIGQMRAYAFMGDTLTWDGWLNAIRKGNLFVTNGPLLEFTINGEKPGGKIHLPRNGGQVKLDGLIQSIVPLEKAELVINGEKVELGDLMEHGDPNGPGTRFEFEKEIAITKSCWITLQTYSTKALHPVDDEFVQATTNPIWVLVGDQPVRNAESAAYFLRWVDKLTAMAKVHPGWRSEKEKVHVLSQFREARETYTRLREEAN